MKKYLSIFMIMMTVLFAGCQAKVNETIEKTNGEPSVDVGLTSTPVPELTTEPDQEFPTTITPEEQETSSDESTKDSLNMVNIAVFNYKFFDSKSDYECLKEEADSIFITGLKDESITEIAIPKEINGLPVKKILFRDNKNLSSVFFDDSITEISQYAFSGCESLTYVDLPNNLKKIGKRAFAECNSLVNINIPDTVTEIGEGAFRECSSLEEIILPSRLTAIQNEMFCRCSSLTNVYIPETVVKIYSYAFEDCNSLYDIRLPHHLTEIGYGAFQGCDNLAEIWIPDSVNEIEEYAFGWKSPLLFYTQRGSYAETWAKEKEHSVINCSKEDYNAAVSIPVVTPRPAKDPSYATINPGKFGYSICGDTATIYGLNDRTSSVIHIPETIEGYPVVKIAENAFFACTNITDIVFPDTIAFVDNNAFRYCTNLSNITFSSDLTYIGEMAFQDCTSLTEIVIPDGVTEIGSYAFLRCNNLNRVVIPDSITFLFSDVFAGCSRLSTIEMPDELLNNGYNPFPDTAWSENNTEEDGLQIINGNLFSAPYSLEGHYTVEEGITCIGYDAFSERELTSIEIPSSVIYIDESAFASCRKLSSIIVKKGSYAEQWAKENGYGNILVYE